MQLTQKQEAYILKKYSDTKRYKIWKASHTIFLYDKTTKRRKSLNKELQQLLKVKKPPRPPTPPTPIKPKAKSRSGISLNHSHLWKCNCLIKPNEKYKHQKTLFTKEHYYYVLSRKGIPSRKQAIQKHDKDYPHHQLLQIDYMYTKQPNLGDYTNE